MKNMGMNKNARIIKGLRAAGWSDTQINDFMLYVEEENETFMEKLKNKEYENQK